MNINEWTDQMRDAGYRLRFQEQASTQRDRETGAFPSFEIYTIYSASDGEWLGRVFLQEARENDGKTACGVFVFWESEDNRLVNDLAELKRRIDSNQKIREARG